MPQTNSRFFFTFRNLHITWVGVNQLLLRAVADAQGVLEELKGELSIQGEEVASFAEQQRKVNLFLCLAAIRLTMDRFVDSGEY